MIQARHAVAISCGALLLVALAATSYYVRSQQGNVQQATIQSGVVLLPGETLVAPPDPVATSEAPPAPVKSKPAPAAPKYRKQPSTPQYTRDEMARGR
jgi:hypothetical protein